MATKPKTTPTPSVTAPANLVGEFAKAVKLVDTGKHADAVKLLAPLVAESDAAGAFALKRRAQVYLAIAEHHANPAKAADLSPLTEIQACLNRGETEGAIQMAEKAIKATPTQGVLHYLRAVAFAQGDNAEGAADSLRKATELDGDLVYQWHMEPDFNSVRKSPLFAFTENR
jgi:predicted Zn-dependent protease